MLTAHIKNHRFFLAVFVAACVGFPGKGYSEDKRTGFYAGPLSAAAESVVEKVAAASDKAPSQEDPAKAKGTGHLGDR
jgi:hypothetical protein